MKVSDIKKVFYLVCGVLAFRIGLDVAYVFVISDAYASVGFERHYNFQALAISYCALAAVMALLLPLRSSLSIKCAQFLCLFSMVPQTSYFAWTGNGGDTLVQGLVFWSITIAIVWVLKINRGIFVFRNDSIVIILSFALGLSAVVLCFIVFGFRLHFSIFDVYEFRAEQGFQKVPLGGYIIPWAAKIAVPFLILYFSYATTHKKKSLLAMALVAQVLLFAISGHKTFLFMIPALFIVSWLAVSSRFISNLAWVAAGGILFSVIFDVLSSGYTLNGLLVRRIFFVPAQLTYMYFDFFHANSMHLSHSIFSSFLDYPYTLPPPKMIGLSYFGSAAQAANTGVLADGYMNFGFVGVLIWAVMLGFTLILVEKVSFGKNPKITYPLVLLSVYTMLNGAFLTSLLTHGLLLAVLLVLMLKVQPSRA